MGRFSAVISASFREEAGRRELAERLARRLQADFAADVVLAPDLYDLTEDHPALAALRAIRGPLVVFCPMYPRAAYWLCARWGIEGERADEGGGADGAGGGDLPLDTSARPIVPVDLREGESVDDLLAKVPASIVAPYEASAASAASAPSGPPGQARILRLAEPLEERWYPVLDYRRCIACMECLEFCLFGVYDEDEAGRPTVAEPDRCKPGCPACARVCPAGAIIFPRHAGAPAIAGAEAGSIEPLTPDTLRQDALRADCAEAARRYLAHRHAECGCAPGEECDCPREGCPPDCPRAGVAPLERAIDELDAFEA